MSDLHGKYASETHKREDALTNATPSSAMNDKEVNDANTEVQRLQALILQHAAMPLVV